MQKLKSFAHCKYIRPDYDGTLAIHRTTYYDRSTYYDRTTMNGQSSIVIWSYIFVVCWCEFEQGISYFVNLNPIFNRQGFFLSLWQYRIYSPLIKKVARDCVSGGLHACVIYFCPCGHLCICFSSSVELSSTTSQGKY